MNKEALLKEIEGKSVREAYRIAKEEYGYTQSLSTFYKIFYREIKVKDQRKVKKETAVSTYDIGILQGRLDVAKQVIEEYERNRNQMINNYETIIKTKDEMMNVLRQLIEEKERTIERLQKELEQFKNKPKRFLFWKRG